jgi:hypothetical protein
MPNAAQARLNGKVLPSQCDINTRWPDGRSVQHAVVSFAADLPPSGKLAVHFVNTSQPILTSGLNEAGMLSMNWAAEIDVTSGSFQFVADVQSLSQSDRGGIERSALWTQYMPSPGGRPNIGLFPAWYARVICTRLSQASTLSCLGTRLRTGQYPSTCANREAPSPTTQPRRCRRLVYRFFDQCASQPADLIHADAFAAQYVKWADARCCAPLQRGRPIRSEHRHQLCAAR